MGYRNAEKTKLKLIIAAEALVATHGLAGVSAREIARQSGHRNNVVVQYHFTSIDQLFDEVVKFRMGQFEAMRARQLEDLSRQGREALSLENLMELVCLPHLRIRNDRGRYPYAAFLCHYLPERRPFGFGWAMDAGESSTPVMQHIIRQIRACLPHLPDMIFNRRMTNATLVFLNILRGLPDDAEGGNDLSHHPLIIDGMRQAIALLNAPWSAAPGGS
ncbi:MAG: TetR/AcrR family transcriptional regulator [Sphingobium sp.]